MPTPKVLSIQRVRALLRELDVLPDDEFFDFWEAHGKAIVECAQMSTTVTDPVQGKERHALALECLCAVSVQLMSAAAMWNDVPCREVLLHACQLTEPSEQEARKSALGALINLSVDSSIAEAMWRHDVCHRVIRDACMEESKSCPENALSVLSYFLAEKGVYVTEFWADTALRQAVIAHAACSGESTHDVNVRARALECLARATSDPDVWWDADSRRAILDASKVRVPSCHCVAEWALYALQQLTMHPFDELMWDDLDCRRCLVDAANFDGWQTSKPLSDSLCALRNLATRPRISAEMVLEAGVLQSVTKASQCEDEEVQRIAIELLNQLASVTNASIVWATTATILSPLLNFDVPYFEDVLALLSILARDPFVAADMLAKFPTIPALADEAATLAEDVHGEVRKCGIALRLALSQSRSAPDSDGPDLSIAELPPDLVSGKLRQQQRVAAIEEWVLKVEALISLNQRTVNTEITATTSEYNDRVSTAIQDHQDRVNESVDVLKQQMDDAATTKGARMLKITEVSEKLDQQRAELGEAKESLEEARTLLAVFSESKAQSKRKATDAPEPTTPTSKRSRPDVMTPPHSAGKPAIRERPEFHFCPITHEVMVDPVMAADGVSYERASITEWLSKRNTSPMHGSELSCVTVFTNQVLKQLIAEWVD